MYKSMGAKHSNWQLSQNNKYVSYALLSLGGQYFDIGQTYKATFLKEFFNKFASL